MEVSLDCAERPARQRGDLVERAFREEAQGDNLPIGFIQAGNGVADGHLALATQDETFGIRRSIGSEPRDRIVERPFRGHAGTDPGNGLPTRGLADGKAYRDPGQPGAERAIPTPRAKGPVGGHERLLGNIFGLPKITEDAVASSDDRGRLAVHKGAKGVPITTKDCLDNCGVISGWLQGLRCG